MGIALNYCCGWIPPSRGPCRALRALNGFDAQQLSASQARWRVRGRPPIRHAQAPRDEYRTCLVRKGGCHPVRLSRLALMSLSAQQQKGQVAP
eukprot:CAMPEP_0115574956 /NCGR_PEP_ID=MMETSP0272-20121206/1789_1 /TAXON_ID=71861 /ORGANISM="Scrippsiella trochoidea, Strain CCMP3099" /LENGTH=92 /DNA_ID=CAMNT_0003009683 /DNA_START=419 /DNA_END=697 /DNA_ORIENTATION=-